MERLLERRGGLLDTNERANAPARVSEWAAVRRAVRDEFVEAPDVTDGGAVSAAMIMLGPSRAIFLPLPLNM